MDKRRSLTGDVFTVGGCAVSWRATLQPVVAQSTTEAEYMAIAEACKESIWLKGLYAELGGDDSCVKLFFDSQSVIYLRILTITGSTRCELGVNPTLAKKNLVKKKRIFN